MRSSIAVFAARLMAMTVSTGALLLVLSPGSSVNGATVITDPAQRAHLEELAAGHDVRYAMQMQRANGPCVLQTERG
ncbi:MAG TPA: hypothetical protein VKB34_16765 [Povalibacter sp.]|nr:hypothetical protein [Povalibacter sp.]